jgi:TonB family protein
MLQAPVATQSSDAVQIFQTAHDASDIRSLGAFVLDAKIAASGTQTFEGKYRLVYVSDRNWREEILMGSDYLSYIQKDDTLYSKSTGPEIEDLLNPFEEIGNYAMHFSGPDGASWKSKERKSSEGPLQCLRSHGFGWEKEYCFANGLLVGDGDQVKYTDFREIVGKKYPFSWKSKTKLLSYAGTIERIVRANVDPKYLEPDSSFQRELSIPCSQVIVTSPRLKSQVPPVYPSIAKRARVEGAVVIKAHIDEGGVVTDAHVLRGHAMLARSAVEAVRQWKYEPPLCEGRPTAVNTTITVNYDLRP